MIKKVILAMLSGLVLWGCRNAKPKYQEPKPDQTVSIQSAVALEAKEADLSAYSHILGKKAEFKQVELSQILEFIQNKGTGVFYFGNAESHYDQVVLPLLNEAMKRSAVLVYYIDTKAEVQEKDYQSLVKALKGSLKKDQSKNPIFLSPFVVAIKEGQVVDSQISLVNNQVITSQDQVLSDEEKKAQIDRYIAMFQAIATK